MLLLASSKHNITIPYHYKNVSYINVDKNNELKVVTVPAYPDIGIKSIKCLKIKRLSDIEIDRTVSNTYTVHSSTLKTKLII